MGAVTEVAMLMVLQCRSIENALAVLAKGSSSTCYSVLLPHLL
jgi:hypothetical protein